MITTYLCSAMEEGELTMNKEKLVLSLWKECKNVFQSSSNEQLKELLKNILQIVEENYNIFQEKADLEFLNYIVQMNVDEYFIGTNGDNFEMILKKYLQKDDMSVEELWHILSQLIWDLTVPVTDNICPFCRCDHLVLLVDKEKKHIYQSCENCFWISEEGLQITRPDSLFPASKDMIKYKDIHP